MLARIRKRHQLRFVMGGGRCQEVLMSEFIEATGGRNRNLTTCMGCSAEAHYRRLEAVGRQVVFRLQNYTLRQQ
jgi:hypothetical protein